jgi:hypothetical protein
MGDTALDQQNLSNCADAGVRKQQPASTGGASDADAAQRAQPVNRPAVESRDEHLSMRLTGVTVSSRLSHEPDI